MINKTDEVVNALRASTAIVNLLKGAFVYWLKSSVEPAPQNYITLFEVSNNESESADDEEYANDIEIQVDIWTPGSTIQIAKEVQKVMRQLGFTHQAMPDTYDDKIKKYHKSIRFSTIETV